MFEIGVVLLAASLLWVVIAASRSDDIRMLAIPGGLFVAGLLLAGLGAARSQEVHPIVVTGVACDTAEQALTVRGNEEAGVSVGAAVAAVNAAAGPSAVGDDVCAYGYWLIAYAEPAGENVMQVHVIGVFDPEAHSLLRLPEPVAQFMYRPILGTKS
jgi:hypothetical protein